MCQNTLIEIGLGLLFEPVSDAARKEGNVSTNMEFRHASVTLWHAVYRAALAFHMPNKMRYASHRHQRAITKGFCERNMLTLFNKPIGVAMDKRYRCLDVALVRCGDVDGTGCHIDAHNKSSRARIMPHDQRNLFAAKRQRIHVQSTGHFFHGGTVL